MTRLGYAAVLASLLLHCAVVYALVAKATSPSLNEGHGDDNMSIVATISMVNDDLGGMAEVSRQAQEQSAAANAVPPPPKQEEPKPEPQKPDNAEKPDDRPPPPKPVEQKPPEPKPAQTASIQQDVQEEEEAATRSLEARRSSIASLYQGEVFTALGRHKVNPRSNKTGRVIVMLTIAPSGKLLSHEVVQSSGSDILDRAAVASLEKAAPFPPIPRDLGVSPLTLRVPFEYTTR